MVVGDEESVGGEEETGARGEITGESFALGSQLSMQLITQHATPMAWHGMA